MAFLLEASWVALWLPVILLVCALAGWRSRSPVPWILMILIPVALEIWSPVKPFTWWLLVPALWVTAHPWLTAGVVAGYLCAGVVVAFVRWSKLVYDAREAVDEDMLRRWPAIKSGTEGGGKHQRGEFIPYTPKEVEQGLREALRNLRRSAVARVTGREEYPPQIAHFKGRFTAWAAGWPFVGVWMVIDDPVRRFFNWAYLRLSGTLQAVSNRAFRDLEPEGRLRKEEEL